MNIKVDKDGRLDLAYKGLKEIPFNAIGKKCEIVKTMDLSHNSIVSLNHLDQFQNLESLILDHNRVPSRIVLNGKLPKLKLLYVNSNKINNLSVFIEKIAEICPNLRSLSMLNNKACPNYFNGGTIEQYEDYRLFVISRFPNLTELDVTRVTDEEREKAKSVYGDLTIQPLVKLKEQRRLERKRRKEEERKRRLEEEKKLQEQQAPPPPPVNEQPPPPPTNNLPPPPTNDLPPPPTNDLPPPPVEEEEKNEVPLPQVEEDTSESSSDDEEEESEQGEEQVIRRPTQGAELIPTPFLLAQNKLPPVEQESDSSEEETE